jgi:hypothetical protein
MVGYSTLIFTIVACLWVIIVRPRAEWTRHNASPLPITMVSRWRRIGGTMTPQRLSELEGLGRSYATLILIRYLLARVAEQSGQTTQWLAEAKQWAENMVKTAIPDGMTDEESIMMADKGLESIRFAFSSIYIEPPTGGAS